MIKLNQTDEQKKNLFLSNQAEAFRNIAAQKGDKGSQRKLLTSKEVAKSKAKRKRVKMSRKKNRKSA